MFKYNLKFKYHCKNSNSFGWDDLKAKVFGWNNNSTKAAYLKFQTFIYGQFFRKYVVDVSFLSLFYYYRSIMQNI